MICAVQWLRTFVPDRLALSIPVQKHGMLIMQMDLFVPIATVAGVVGGDKNVKTDMSYRCAAVTTRDQQSPIAEFCKSSNPSKP